MSESLHIVVISPNHGGMYLLTPSGDNLFSPNEELVVLGHRPENRGEHYVVLNATVNDVTNLIENNSSNIEITDGAPTRSSLWMTLPQNTTETSSHIEIKTLARQVYVNSETPGQVERHDPLHHATKILPSEIWTKNYHDGNKI